MILDQLAKAANVAIAVIVGVFAVWLLVYGAVRRLKKKPSPEPAAKVLEKEELEELEGKLETAERKNREYFALIESVIAQRDLRWKMFLEQSSGHQHAQAIYESTLIRERQILFKAVTELNKMRKVAGLPTVERPEDLAAPDAPPIGLAKAFAENVEGMKKEAGVDIDGIAERDRIAGS
jgi:hypothetical protein